jgi:hypothetical protein
VGLLPHQSVITVNVVIITVIFNIIACSAGCRHSPQVFKQSTTQASRVVQPAQQGHLYYRLLLPLHGTNCRLLLLLLQTMGSRRS